MFGEGHANVEEDLLEARYSKLRLDLRRGGRDLRDRFEDRRPGGDDVVASDRRIPISSVLMIISRCKNE